MTADGNPTVPAPDEPRASAPRNSERRALLQLPGLVAISLYMLLLSAIAVLYVVNHRIGVVYLVFSVLFIAGALGLLLLLRWAWALTLAAVALLSAMFLFQYFAQHEISSLLQGLLNLVFFLYLVRTDVREKLK